MKFGSRRVFFAGGAVACLLAATGVMGQAPSPQDGAIMAEKYFKNVQVLKGIPVNQFMETMGFFSASLGLNCAACHVAEALQDWDKFADDVPKKRTARQMVVMVNAMNKANFGGARVLTCYTCHRASDYPPSIPSLADQYNLAPEDPNAVEPVEGVVEDSADKILDKYIQALGGAQKLAGITSFTAKGTTEGYDTYHAKVPLEIYAKAPAQRTIVSHTQNGDSTTVFDGKSGWVAGINNPLRLLALLPGAELDGARLDAVLCFPTGLKQALHDWRIGFPVTSIDDKTVNIIEGKGAGGSRVKLYFQTESGLLVRQVRYSDTIVGTVPTQVDYSDYRDVGGVKMPYKFTVTWTDGQEIVELSEIKPNVQIEAARFAKPAPAAVKPLGAKK